MGLFKFRKNITADIQNGYTLLELLITTTVVVILTTVAAPSFASMINNAQIKSASRELSQTLALSRSHALKTGITVIVCHARDSSMSKCSVSRNRNTNWSNGIISYADTNANNILDEDDQVLGTMQKHANIALVFNQNGRLRFFPSGGSRSSGFYLCSKSTARERHLKILHTGRTRTSSKMGSAQRQICLSKAG